MRRHPEGVRFYTPRDPEFVPPGTDEWRRVITPSKVAAILGEPGDPVSRYESPFRLWNRMTGRVAPEEPRDAYQLGHRVESLAAGLYRDDRPDWRLSPGEVQAHVDPGKFGFPAMATLDRRGVRGASRRVVEFKLARNLDDLEVWGDDLTGDLPDDYHAQVTALMLFTGWTAIPGELLVIGPYLQHRIYTVDYNRQFAALIIEKCRRFYESLSADEPPPLDNSKATYECLRALHPDIDRGVEALIPDDEARDFVAAREQLAAAADEFALRKNHLLKRMERAQYAITADAVNEATGKPIRIADRRRGRNDTVALYPAKNITAADIPTR
ncbi:YqaJ viral recombinase family protein [Mycobacterium sp. MYCO198283]|uniref:YqaJ viral recombinase family protein n=1 Tax=Mycobacterium sp. MYCO198283 TaxID=2883505 RepID=UPI001E5F352A|nr:YqaJ viral recombinase family protein [Mycobacterium sp. MYCO198283]MCG5431198.1 YqaJ viral recombinase family protein [Mycobacterium sp. MYCO198283]